MKHSDISDYLLKPGNKRLSNYYSFEPGKENKPDAPMNTYMVNNRFAANNLVIRNLGATPATPTNQHSNNSMKRAHSSVANNKKAKKKKVVTQKSVMVKGNPMKPPTTNAPNPMTGLMDMANLSSNQQIHISSTTGQVLNEAEKTIPKEYDFENHEFGELTYNGAFSEYVPSHLKIGKSHPYTVVESRSMSSMKAPEIRYNLQIPSEITDTGVLSDVQLEALVYSCQKHEEYLKDGRRAGFLIGDGAGVGKGRTVAGIIYENYLCRRNKAIWISVSNDLKEDAIRDLNDIGKEICMEIPVKPINKMSYAKIDSKENGEFAEGVLFVTYSSLISQSSSYMKNKKNLFKTRLEQIIDWFGIDYDGVIIFDESHKAKNLHGGKKKKEGDTQERKASKTGTIVKEIQDVLKHSRVVYASATGATEPKHMAYMVRLGLWGPDNLFKIFEDFESTLTKHGVGAMELIAIEMKMKGVYLARQLSFRDVLFEIQEIKVENSSINGHKLKHVYAESVNLWTKIHDEFNEAFRRNEYPNKIKLVFTAQYWSSHQRYFKYLCMSAKIPECVRVIKAQIESGKCVVLGLQSTGEARTIGMLEESSGNLFDFVSSGKGVVKSLIKSFYPSMANLKKFIERKEKVSKIGAYGSENESPDSDIEEEPKVVKRKPTRPRNITTNKVSVKDAKDELSVIPLRVSLRDRSNKMTTFAESEECASDDSDFELTVMKAPIKNVKKKEQKDFNISFKEEIFKVEEEKIDNSPEGKKDSEILNTLWKLIADMETMFPINVLDHLIHELGGPDAVSEMTGRKGRMVARHGRISYESRKEDGYSLDQINILEKNRFNSGQKLIGIISDAASTGISLHSDKRFRNQRQRVHVTLELPWSADKAIQQFGRTHRSNQVIPPRYLFLISDLAGERRFAATVAKRLESLGALTHGDRRCADTRDLSQFNLDNEFGYHSVVELVNVSLYRHRLAVPYPVDLMSKYDNNQAKLQDDIEKSLNNVGIDINSKMSVPKFLNRILGIELDLQNGLFQYFLDIVDHKAQCAKSRNEFDHGIRDIMNKNDNINLEETQILRVKSTSDKDEISVHKVINVTTGIAWEFIVERYENDTVNNKFCMSKRGSVKILVLAELQKKDEYKLITVQFPPKTISRNSLRLMYNDVTFEFAKKQWQHIHKESENKCLHRIDAGTCLKENCTYGKRTKVSYIITGAVFIAWKLIRTVYRDLRMEVIRVELQDGMKLIGALVYYGNYNLFMEVLEKYCDCLRIQVYEPKPIVEEKKPLAILPSFIVNEKKPLAILPSNIVNEQKPLVILPSDIVNEQKSLVILPSDIVNEQKSLVILPSDIVNGQKPLAMFPSKIVRGKQPLAIQPRNTVKREYPVAILPQNVVNGNIRRSSRNLPK